MNILVTGADGFIGRNLRVALAERGWACHPITRTSTEQDIRAGLIATDAVMHLAGVNRPADATEFTEVNTSFTRRLCALMRESGRALPLAISSSIQAVRDNPYGLSKKTAEEAALQYGRDCDAKVGIFRLSNVFGKWCKPNYNSVVATFCHNLTRDLPIEINDPTSPVSLVYIDDVVEALLRFMQQPRSQQCFLQVEPVYHSTVGAIATQLRAFAGVRANLVTEPVGNGIVRALYSTYISYLPQNKFSYALPKFEDKRGMFVEMLKTKDSGQFSYFTAHPGITRGGHYHHSKTEKFLVIQGKALFKFRHIVSDETFSVETQGDAPRVVETIPGWAHDITNIGTDEMVVMLWANENYNQAKPDTVAAKVF